MILERFLGWGVRRKVGEKEDEKLKDLIKNILRINILSKMWDWL